VVAQTRGLCRYLQMPVISNVRQDKHCAVMDARLVQSVENSISGPERQQLFQMLEILRIYQT
jgi:hypothetical protein